ncbi:hypothetical protein [Desulfurobacterium crinifex]
MVVAEISLAVIAVCMVVITIASVGLATVTYRLLKKFEESVDTVNNQLRPAVIELKKTVLNLTEAFQMVNDTVSFIRKFRKK